MEGRTRQSMDVRNTKRKKKRVEESVRASVSSGDADRDVGPSSHLASHPTSSTNERVTDAEAQNRLAEQTPVALTGLKKWIAEYRAKRPGLEVLQRQIDEFMADYDAKEEQARKKREAAAAADDGWTLVVNKGGRRKTTDESGISVGAVATAVATERAKEKQSKEGARDFYRFQKREVRRNEVQELQKRFEDDKKRIAKMKAARKFCPY